MKEGPETLFLFVFGELCLLLSSFGLICYTFVFICFILALFVVKISFKVIVMIILGFCL